MLCGETGWASILTDLIALSNVVRRNAHSPRGCSIDMSPPKLFRFHACGATVRWLGCRCEHPKMPAHSSLRSDAGREIHPAWCPARRGARCNLADDHAASRL